MVQEISKEAFYRGKVFILSAKKRIQTGEETITYQHRPGSGRRNEDGLLRVDSRVVGIDASRKETDDLFMGTKKDKRSDSSSTSPCAHLRAAYHQCFNRWYSEKFLKGQWNKDECVSEWQKYRDCLSHHLEDKHLSRILEAEAIIYPPESCPR